jgi:hypothetical protein
MKLLLKLVLCSALVATFFAPFDTADARSCYSIWADVDGQGSHFRHFVYVENDCDEWLQCTVWTDVNPQPPKVISVAPGAVESVETNGHSQYGDPRAFGNCHFK